MGDGRDEPASHRVAIGDFEMITVRDGVLDVSWQSFPKADAAAAEALRGAAGLAGKETVPSAVNAFVLRRGGTTLLVDAGCGTTVGPQGGHLPDNLRAIGIDPAAIDAVLVTHLHRDHSGGLVDPDGGRTFPNAELIVHERDWSYWMDDGHLARAGDRAKLSFKAAREGVAPYGDRIRRFDRDQELFPGIVSVLMPGHTPGHTGFLVASGDDSVLIWGDVVHSAVYQLARPDWGVAFDVDHEEGVATRRRVFDRAAADGQMVAGMHLNAPSFGHVVREGEGYRFIPAPG